MEQTTTILASGPNWALRRDGVDPVTLELRGGRFQLIANEEATLLAIELPSSLSARIVGAPSVVGEVLHVGDMDQDTARQMIGCPCIVVSCTREALKSGPPLVYREVQVTPDVVGTLKHEKAEG